VIVLGDRARVPGLARDAFRTPVHELASGDPDPEGATGQDGTRAGDAPERR
jgi:hypothetical protein